MKIFLWLLVWIFIAGLASCAYNSAQATATIRLTGAQEVPPVTTAASGTGKITVLSNRAITGSVSITGMAATAAHIHEAASGGNGPVIIPLTKTSDDTWSVPADTRLTTALYAAYLTGNLYLNVHSATHPGGEIRGQITPLPPPPQPVTHYGY